MEIPIGAVKTIQSARQLEQKLEHIRSSPNQHNQRHAATVLKATEDTLQEQNSDFTPTAYFAALLALLNQHITTGASINNEVATAVVYLLDIVSAQVPAAVLRSKFTPILNSLAPALIRADVDAPFLRSSIGCLESLLLAQDSQAWALPQTQISPRKAVAGLLALATDSRPKVRKRAQEGLFNVLSNGPPSPSLDHPAAEMCAETGLKILLELTNASEQKQQIDLKQKPVTQDSSLIHLLQLIRVIASASNGWPSRSLESLCAGLFSVAKSRSELLTMTAFEVFETVFEGIPNDASFSKLPRLLEAVLDLEPSQNDSSLLPPWLATLSRGYEVLAHIEPLETFQKLPELFQKISPLLASSSYNIRTSAAESLVSFLTNCVPNEILLGPSVDNGKMLEKLCAGVLDLLSLQYQASWMEVFQVLGAAFDALRWRSYPLLSGALIVVDELRKSEAFAGKDKADQVLSKAIAAMGPAGVFESLPLNILSSSPTKPGRAWLIPLLRDSVSNTNLMHFKNELLPLSERLFARVLEQQESTKTVETKIWETLIQQIWSCLPGYCTRPMDVEEAFDQSFAELIATLLYRKPDLRNDICKALQALVNSLKSITEIVNDQENLVVQGRISKSKAQKGLDHLTLFAPDLAAVLFNVYEKTSPQQRAPILACIDVYLGIMKADKLTEIFDRVTTMLASSLKGEEFNSKTQSSNSSFNTNESFKATHSLMDIVITMAIYLPRESYQSLFGVAATVLSRQHDPQMQKKAYKLLPRLAQSVNGRTALQERSAELQLMMLNSAESTSIPARRDRLLALSEILDLTSSEDLYFVPSILPEVILCTKESNEKAREAAYNLVVRMGEKMSHGGIVDNSKVVHMPTGAPPVTASLEEFFTMLSAGLAGSTPHMVSASITAISRALYQFKELLHENTVTDLVETMDLFLKSSSREIVGSVLGFVKVCVLGLPQSVMLPRLPSLIPHLISWSHEHKAHFKVKVKNILERMIRKYGVEMVERHCPQEDRKLITNIRKKRERQKRKKNAADEESDEATGEAVAGGTHRSETRQQAPRFMNEFDDAIYGSDSDESIIEGPSDDSRGKPTAKSNSRNKKRQETYIHEDDDEPLDLLSRNALASISSTKPAKPRQPPSRRAVEMNIDGKLVLKGDKDEASSANDDAMDLDGLEAGDDTTLEQGINAYVEAIRGRDAPTRGHRGRLKFSNKRRRSTDGENDDDEDDKDVFDGRSGPTSPRGNRRQGRYAGKPSRRPLERGRIGGGRIVKARGGSRASRGKTRR